jgi:NAD(P)-dependent dehydrogenase (short-subunit alcohol dehydrogenase family)
MRGLEGKSAVVTGAARGIGLATVERLAREGTFVVGVDRHLGGAAERERVRWCEADVTDADAMAAAVELAVEPTGRLDVCIANAGIGGVEYFLEGTPSSWAEVLAVNLVGAMVTLQAAAKRMVASGTQGRLLATASIAGVHGEPGTPAYCASKGGLISLMQALAVELAPYRITANAVAPGQIDTELNARDVRVLSAEQGRDPDEFRDRFLAERVPANRMGAPEEVAALYAFLASDEAPYVNGETIRIDGGELAV